MTSSKLWYEYEVVTSDGYGFPVSFCGLCGNSGIMPEIKTKTPIGRCLVLPAGRFCICPNGRKLKRKKRPL
jgi:hypothetical protein